MLTQDFVALGRAKLLVHQERPHYDEATGLWGFQQVGEDDEAWNLITNTGRVQLHTQVYASSGILTNGFNWIAVTNDSTSPAATDTVLASELSGSGLSRVQGMVTLPTGSGTSTTVVTTFTYTGGSQAVQKTALFTASSGGVMNHEILFTQRTLFTNDTLTLTFTITTS